MFLTIVAILLVLAVAIDLVWKRISKRSKADLRPAMMMTSVMDEIDVQTGILDYSEEVNDIFIAGLAHHVRKKDVGYFTGVIGNEPDNPYDRKAMAVYHNQLGKIVGYVPAAILKEYRSWCGRRNCKCVGYIFFDGEYLRGRVRAYLPDLNQEEIVQDALKYLEEVAEHFGWPTEDVNLSI